MKIIQYLCNWQVDVGNHCEERAFEKAKSSLFAVVPNINRSSKVSHETVGLRRLSNSSGSTSKSEVLDCNFLSLCLFQGFSVHLDKWKSHCLWKRSSSDFPIQKVLLYLCNPFNVSWKIPIWMKRRPSLTATASPLGNWPFSQPTAATVTELLLGLNAQVTHWSLEEKDFLFFSPFWSWMDYHLLVLPLHVCMTKLFSKRCHLWTMRGGSVLTPHTKAGFKRESLKSLEVKKVFKAASA